MNRKIEITSKVLKILKPDYTEKDFKQAKHNWWVNPRVKTRGGFKLTKEGFDALMSADIKYYKIKIEEKIRAKDVKTVLDLDQQIDAPYYFLNSGSINYIFVFDERTAVQVMLFSGNILKMIRAVQRFKEKQG